jgi:hypothetical protein
METQEPLVQPQEPLLKLSWREKYAGILVLIIGIIYLIFQVSDFASSRAGAYAVKDGALQVSTSELLNHARTIFTILLAISGGLLLLNGKKAGWVIGLPILSLLTLIVAGILAYNFRTTGNTQKIMGGVALFILLLAILFLLLPSARKKYKVGKYTYLPTLVLLVVLAALYFFLQ